MIKILTIHKYKGKQKVALTDNEGVVYMGLYASRLRPNTSVVGLQVESAVQT